MLSHKEIRDAVVHTATLYPIKKASYFGSYAESRQTNESDLDMLLEFKSPAVSLFMLSGVKSTLEDLLKIPVDVIHAPIPSDSFIKVGKVVDVFG